MDFQQVLALCLEKGIPFYAFRLPGDTSYNFGAQLDNRIQPLDDVADISGQEGFVAVPFQEDEGAGSFFIRGDVRFADALTDETDISRLQSRPAVRRTGGSPSGSVTWEDYGPQAAAVIRALRQGKARKAVLARREMVEAGAYRCAPVWFDDFAVRYPDAFVFLVSLPGVMTWMGATPEILLRQRSDTVETMSLAGTRKAGTPGPWGAKEVEEQAIVTDYIADLLRPTAPWQQEGPSSRQAGKVEHLCTRFRHEGRLSLSQVEHLRRALHPTPAVGGFPLHEALDIIRRVEGVHRRYYSGYIGPWHADGTFAWFVNLRSMELFPEAVQLYIGGGLTALSDVRSEWEETVMKSRTLLDVIKHDRK